MDKKPKTSYKVTLIPHHINEKTEKDLLTELAHIFYDLNCQFCKTSLKPTTLHKEEDLSSYKPSKEVLP